MPVADQRSKKGMDHGRTESENYACGLNEENVLPIFPNAPTVLSIAFTTITSEVTTVASIMESERFRGKPAAYLH